MQFLNMAYFNINTRKYIEIILKSHYENVYVSIEYMANRIQISKKKCNKIKYQVCFKLIHEYCVLSYFYIRCLKHFDNSKKNK